MKLLLLSPTASIRRVFLSFIVLVAVIDLGAETFQAQNQRIYSRLQASEASDTGSSQSLATVNSDALRLNVYEKARTVLSISTSGTLCTVSVHPGITGAPFGSYVDYVLDDNGSPIFLLNERSMHTINFQAASASNSTSGPFVTLFTQLSRGQKDDTTDVSSQDISRCSVTGTLEQLARDDLLISESLRVRYTVTHSSYAPQVVDSPRFHWYRLNPVSLYYVGGFGVSSTWLEPGPYAAAVPDVLALEAAKLCTKLNRQYATDLENTARYLLLKDKKQQLDSVRLTSMDRLGMDVRVTTFSGTRRNHRQTDEYRLGFSLPVQTVEDAVSEVLKIFQEAWEKGNGVCWSMNEEPGSGVPIVQIAADNLE